MPGGEAELDGDTEGVDQFGVAGAEEVCAEDLVGVGIDDDLGGGGGLGDPVGGVPVAGVGKADGSVVAFGSGA